MSVKNNINEVRNSSSNLLRTFEDDVSFMSEPDNLKPGQQGTTATIESKTMPAKKQR